ncbi:hypothetical protein KIN20_007625 [Parelaphostrongylus tenuis]|uniref:Uncharacterized protein n=1 Tax=Parelaphostrongylus tenuis TaxID=148309 RepID=A0AAD5MPB7_PARTN|nr:hypothetical protein KIN20_007625 [Parelaphostrongylus tenuis]
MASEEIRVVLVDDFLHSPSRSCKCPVKVSECNVEGYAIAGGDCISRGETAKEICGAEGERTVSHVTVGGPSLRYVEGYAIAEIDCIWRGETAKEICGAEGDGTVRNVTVGGPSLRYVEGYAIAGTECISRGETAKEICGAVHEGIVRHVTVGRPSLRYVEGKVPDVDLSIARAVSVIQCQSSHRKLRKTSMN